MSEPYQRKSNTACVICQKPIYRRPLEINRNGGRVFCSIACYGISCRKETPCLVCEKPILAKFNKKTCSRSCANIHRAGIRYKMNQPRDKVTTLRALKLRLMKIRGKSCERCGYIRSEIIQVHHKDRNNQNNELYNLELVCPNCHYEEHYLEKSWLNKM